MEITESRIHEIMEKIKSIEAEISKGIIGQREVIRQVLIAIFAGGNVLLEGLPGLGKTQLVKTLGKVLSLSFSRIQFTPDLMPADVLGTNIIVKDAGGSSQFSFQRGPVFSNIVLADEINRATPKTQSALLEAMQEHTVTSSGKTYKLEEPFLVLATQNPIEMEGTYPLPEAQLDRFMFKLNVGFPSLEELYDIVALTTGRTEAEINKVIDGTEILEIRNLFKEVPIARPVMEYALRLVLATHGDSRESVESAAKYIRFGASPRAAQSIILGSKIRAIMEGRYNVSFEDINYIAPSALRHRIILNFDALSEGLSADDVIGEIIKNIKVV